MRPQVGHVTVQVSNGVLTVHMPIEVISEVANVDDLNDEALRKRLPYFGRELAEGFTGQLSEPPVAVGQSERVNAVRVVLTRTKVLGETMVELDSPAEIFT